MSRKEKGKETMKEEGNGEFRLIGEEGGRAGQNNRIEQQVGTRGWKTGRMKGQRKVDIERREKQGMMMYQVR